jgi:hypothetical protein
MDVERRPGSKDAGRSFDDVGHARRFQQRLAEVRPDDRHPADPQVEYDESGYPLTDEKLGLTGRIRRLITG